MPEPHAKVRDYYSGTLERHGPTPLGVDWPNVLSQHLRFVQLLKLCDFARPFSLNDFGCGYGALLEFLATRHGDAEVTYRGIDISPAMIAAARARWAGNTRATFTEGSQCGAVADYSLASGIFNVRLGHPVAAWEEYVGAILADLAASSRIGFAVNFMLPRDDARTEAGLYRTAPERWIGFCKRLGRVEVVTDYGMREFTLLVRRTTTARPETAARRVRRRSPR
ncbi:class I SAM-dependent methyltransferase [Bradyrhizobium tropiciagri]|uniref:class I SAM-dependent methyltransferase n=1 Tax=Bradyrhizobium tropiciagri TaxID=312253 RepID=UPI001BADCFDE|nr:class I SAM-dependent methyltransferase [Bradyrhizobium tropiciagri]MBR0899859.1 class I SAM-dependent methyltransferase [Bradyrhizobium tropiciagri]